MCENIDILNLSQQKEESTIQYQNQIIIIQNISKMFFSNRNENKKQKTQILMNKLVYLVLSIIELSKTLMYELWYDYVKPKCSENAKLCYMDAILLYM